MTKLGNTLLFFLLPVSRLKNKLYRYLIPKHFPIAHKLAIIMTLLISSSMVLLGLVIVNNQTHLLEKQMDRFANTVIKQLADNSKELIMSDDVLSLMVIINNLNSQDNILGAIIYSNEGKVISSSGVNPKSSIQELQLQVKNAADKGKYSQLQWQTYTSTGKAIQATSYISPIIFQNIVAGHALITFSTSEIKNTISEMIRAIVTATIIMIILGIFVSLHMGRRITKPLDSLMNVSHEISEGNYHHHIVERRNDELGQLTDALNSMASGLLEKEKVESIFSQYISKSVAKKVMGNLEQVKLGGNYVNASVIFADIVGFTKLSENNPPEKMAAMLNDYFSYISLACKMYQGTIDKYIGDCAMIIFGVPEQDSSHKLHAVYCAVMIQKLIQRINIIRDKSKQMTVTFRIGINSGNMLAGNLGSTERMQYTVIGESVNLAARLQSIVEENKIIVSSEFYNDPDIKWRLVAEQYKSIQLRGIKEKVSTYLITDVIPLYRDNIDEQINEILRIRPAA